MSTHISPTFLVIYTGYEYRMLEDADYIKLVETADNCYPSVAGIITEGKLQYGSPTEASELILKEHVPLLAEYYKSSVIYTGENLWHFFSTTYQNHRYGIGEFYCKTYGITDMVYNNSVGALFISLDSESG